MQSLYDLVCERVNPNPGAHVRVILRCSHREQVLGTFASWEAAEGYMHGVKDVLELVPVGA